MKCEYFLFPTLVCLFCANCFWAQSSKEDAVEILKKSDEACSKIKTIEYEEELFGAGEDEKSPRRIVKIKQFKANVPEAGNIPGKYLVDGKIPQGGTEQVKFSYSYDGTYLRVLDTEEKLVRVIKSPTSSLVGSVVGEFGVIGFAQFSADNFFKVEIERSDKISYEGTKQVKGELCHIIKISRTVENPAVGKQTISYNWLIGAKDFLPKAFENDYFRREIGNLKINESSTEMDYFAIPTPEGYGEKLVTGNEAKTKGLLAVGEDAPEWNLTDPQGKPHSLKEYRGKVVLIDFWGTWCVPCRKSMPGIQILHERFKNQNVAVFGISVADEEGNPVEYMKKKDFTYGLLLKGDEVATAYQAQVLPTLYIIGKDGKIIHAEFGHRPNSLEELIKIIEKNL